VWSGPRSVCTIQQSGYTRWFTVGAELDGKTLTVPVPDGAAFAVYDANGVCIAHTAAGDAEAVTLVAGGFLAFVGAPGTVFNLTIE
jgi:hypothetical protein